MHELSLCQELIGEVTRIAAAHGAVRASRILVALGPLSGVEAPLLERAFAVARAGTATEGALLEIERQNLLLRCTGCGGETESASGELICGVCGDWRVELLAGDALLLKSVELVLDDAPAAVPG
jgi:hydrogenase nickel incorporation protein HypA/HybF